MSALTVKAVLTSTEGASVEGTEVQVGIFLLTGAFQALGTGKADARGAVTLVTTWQATGNYQPRLQLRVRSGTAFVEASENLQSYANDIADFGSVPLPTVAKATFTATQFTVAQPTATATTGTIPQTSTPTTTTTPVITKPPTTTTTTPTTTPTTTTTTPTTTPTTSPTTTPSSTDTPLQQVLAGTGTQVQAAQDALSGSNFRLGKVSLQLKVLPGSSAGSVVLPKADDIARVGGQSLSQVTFELDSTDGVLTTPAVAEKPLPQVTGYTEALARRKLSEYQVQVLYQLVDRDEDVGRVMLQRPPARTNVKPRDLVTLGIGRKG